MHKFVDEWNFEDLDEFWMKRLFFVKFELWNDGVFMIITVAWFFNPFLF